LPWLRRWKAARAGLLFDGAPRSRGGQEEVMRRFLDRGARARHLGLRRLAVSTVFVCGAVALMGGAAVAGTSSSTTWDYTPLNVPMQLTGNGSVPNGLPLCKSSSLVNIVCYSPAFVKKAYEYPSTAALDGSGQTIVIVDAYGSPTITSDLATFDSAFGIAAPPSFTIFCGDSPTPFDTSTCPVPNTRDTFHDVFGWEIETSLDVQYAHAMAPGANIVLDVAASSSGNAINSAEAAAIAQYPGAVFSQSFGIPEALISGNNGQVLQADKNYAAGVANGDTFFASAGDSGATFGTSTQQGNFPASNPNNTGVTGTQGLPYIPTGDLTVDNFMNDGLFSGGCPTSTLFSCTTGLSAFHGPCVLGRTIPPNCVPDGYGGEQVWNEPQFDAATGGAQSLLFGVPSYQDGLGLTSRGPDVSYNAAVDGGVLVVYGGFGSPVLFIVGGTSAGSPQWAGIAALANQARANLSKGPIGGNLNPTLYSIYHSARYAADFHDITVGNNQLVNTPSGNSAVTGYDLATGIGTPIVDQLIVDLAAS
jgi:subtilase family serine protease